MKKTLLLAALLGAFFTAKAQDTESYTFETSQSYTVGLLSGQNGWNVSQAATSANYTITDEDSAGEGTNALKLVAENGASHTTIGAFSPAFTAVAGDEIAFAFDIKTSELTDNGSDFYVSAQSPTQLKSTIRFRFSYDGVILVLDGPSATELAWTDTDATYEGDTWYHVSAVLSNTDSTITYYVNGEEIYAGILWGATDIEQFVVLHDNYEGQMIVDNLLVSTDVTLNNSAVATTQFSVYPNPATNVINVTNANNSVVNNVAIADINGRTVKTVKFGGVAEAQVNISDLASGVYMVTISSDKGTTTKKIVKN